MEQISKDHTPKPSKKRRTIKRPFGVVVTEESCRRDILKDIAEEEEASAKKLKKIPKRKSKVKP